MKKIEAIIRRISFTSVKTELAQLGISGITVFEAGGFGLQRGHIDEDEQSSPVLLPKYKLEVFCQDDQAQSVIETIAKYAYTGNKGDGKIFVLDVQDAYKIRTKERGEKAV